ncbi:MAG: crossover junction endodeoxyribonuclease RuvC [Gammaproteobacteria bacterium]
MRISPHVQPLVILGIDPGSRVTGYGVIALAGRTTSAIDYGVVRAPRSELGMRIRAIFEGVSALAARHSPDEIAIESSFVHLNPAVALALGQARGAALAGALAAERPLAEYAPRAVKLAIVGSGKAEKIQVALMVRHLLGLNGPIAEDASDALAVALCHAHSRGLTARLAAQA